MPPSPPSPMTSGTAPQRVADDGRAAGHGLDHHQAERLLPGDREERAAGALQQPHLLLVGDLAEVLDVVAEVGRDLALEVLALELVVHLAGDLQRRAGLPGDLDGARGALVGREASQEQQVVAAPGAERVGVEVERVRAVVEPRQLGRRAPLVHGQRDVAQARVELGDLAVDAAHLAVQRAVDRVAHGHGAERGQRRGEQPGVVVDEVEVVGVVPGGEGVLELRNRSARCGRTAARRTSRRARPSSRSRRRRRGRPRDPRRRARRRAARRPTRCRRSARAGRRTTPARRLRSSASAAPATSFPDRRNSCRRARVEPIGPLERNFVEPSEIHLT